MKRICTEKLVNPTHKLLQGKDERELYTNNPVDYYALHYRRRIAAVCECIARRKAQRVLEIGAAQGNMSITCSEAGVFCIVLDVNFDYLTYSKMKYEKGAVCWLQASADALPFKKGCFDAIIIGELLEHCAWPERIFAGASELLTATGVIIVTTPNNSFVQSTEKSFFAVASDRSAIEKHQFGPDGEDHLFTFTDEELASVIAAANLKVVDIRYLGNHFLHVPCLYYLRVKFPFLINVILEKIVPVVPFLQRRYTSTLLFIVEKKR
jgi:2-polyprenyl-3-methyl-5-hydroxy-6-metoxy-1,4-benzoquinol methylase